MQSCLKFGTIATLPLHKVLQHIEIMSILCCKHSTAMEVHLGEVKVK